jgi:hypothetical protein
MALAVETFLGQALERSARRAARQRAAGLAIDRATLRGRACHCPPGLVPHLVHSEGLREACDLVVDDGSNVRHPARPYLPVDVLARVGRQVRRGDAIHVKTDCLDAFVAHVLPSITEPFVLVTGDSDLSAVRDLARLLEHPHVAHWFAQNCDVPFRHPRLTRLPIGLDNPVYTMPLKRAGFLLTMLLGRTPFDPTLRRNDIGDQARLQAVKRRLRRRIDAKPPRALCTFHQNSKLMPTLAGLPARQAAYDALIANPACHFVRRRLRQDACWAIHDDFAFEIAPRGNGLDTFRTWEALALETIPIVQRSPLDPLYDDEALPVVVVDSYREVTAEALVRWQRERAPRFTPDLAHRLTNEYWVEKIRGAQAQARRPG